MPFVDLRITDTLTDDQKETIKAELGQAVSAFGKGESFLMVGIACDYDLWLGGRKLDRGAYVQLSLVGDTPAAGCKAFSASLADILARVAEIPADQVYVTFHPLPGSRWGWNGGTF